MHLAGSTERQDFIDLISHSQLIFLDVEIMFFSRSLKQISSVQAQGLSYSYILHNVQHNSKLLFLDVKKAAEVPAIHGFKQPQTEKMVR